MKFYSEKGCRTTALFKCTFYMYTVAQQTTISWFIQTDVNSVRTKDETTSNDTSRSNQYQLYSGAFKTTDNAKTLTIPCRQEDGEKQRTGTSGPCQNLAFFNDCLEKQTVLVQDQYLWMHLQCDRGKPSQFTKDSYCKRSGLFFGDFAGCAYRKCYWSARLITILARTVWITWNRSKRRLSADGRNERTHLNKLHTRPISESIRSLFRLPFLRVYLAINLLIVNNTPSLVWKFFLSIKTIPGFITHLLLWRISKEQKPLKHFTKY